jgi:hypothetical protein
MGKSRKTARRPKQQAEAAKWTNGKYYAYAFLLLAVVFFAAVRFRLRTMPLERDEGEYAYSGQLMLQGIPPYKLAYTSADMNWLASRRGLANAQSTVGATKQKLIGRTRRTSWGCSRERVEFE